MKEAPVPISVIIPTHNREGLLIRALESLCDQSLPVSEFEVVVVDDGSTDRTYDLCKGFAERVDLRYERLSPSGIAAAKNVGLFASRGEIAYFFDDDDFAHRHLLSSHVLAHRDYPDERVAILGYTTWHPQLDITPVMHYVTEVGQYLFSYPSLQRDELLDFTHFWGGRTSVKRAFLVRHGIFNQDFTFGYEDIELGFRLSKHGLTVVYRPEAISYMLRPITVEGFCRRCEQQGMSLARFAALHGRDPVVKEYCHIEELSQYWESAATAHANPLEVETAKASTSELYDSLFRTAIAKGVAMHSASAPRKDNLASGATSSKEGIRLDDILANPPRPHLLPDGAAHLWGVGDAVLRFLWDHVRPGDCTLETGSGISSVILALCGATHIVVTPSEREVASLKDYCATRGISLERVTFAVEASEHFLPSLNRNASPTSLDLVLVDGRHGFPAPFIDWFYTDALVRIGGLMIIDDCQLWTGAVLRDFLNEEPGWALEDEFDDKTAVFRKTGASTAEAEWSDQQFVVARSDAMRR